MSCRLIYIAERGNKLVKNTSIRFEFADEAEAGRAYETLAELGYRPMFDQDAYRPGIYIRPYRQDLTSAIEIAQTFGGELHDTENTSFN